MFFYMKNYCFVRGQQAAAIGMSAFNLEAMVFGPFYFAELELIEWKAE